MPTYGNFLAAMFLCFSAWSVGAGANNVSITSDGQYRYIKSNGIPYSSGTFPNPGNPNAIAAQQYNFRVPLYPRLTGRISQLQGGMSFGVGMDGIPFDPGTAETWNNDPSWREEAIVGSTKRLGLDFNNAHVQPNGAYHYHGMPTEITSGVSSNSFSPLIGWAADGFPIYAQYGYVNADNPGSGIKQLMPSYRLKSGTRPGSPTGPGGSYDGTYTADFEYVVGLGDLDECNGRFGPTPDYPDGTYYYVITWDFPRVPRCFKGTADNSFKKTGGGQRGDRQRQDEQNNRYQGAGSQRPAGRRPPPPPR